MPHHKLTAKMATVTMPAPETVTIPMQQHVGAPCVPLVKKGDHVYRGQKIGDSDAFISAPIHASVSGEVVSIEKIPTATGQFCEAVVIASDGLMESSPELTPPIVSNAKDFSAAVRESGLVGLGGAGFPAHVKLSIPQGKKADTLIINAAECEPYVTADHREAMENTKAVLEGIYAVKSILNISRVIIAVEDNKPDVIEVLEKIADDTERDPNDEVRVLTLRSRYPQGAEKVLIKSCTGREVPPGKLPIDVGCIVMNITSVAFLATYLKTGMPLVSKRITVSGTAVQAPKNVMVPIGTKISQVIEFCGGYSVPPKKLIMGGPMMGIALTGDQFPILKQNNAILAFDEKEARLMEPTACIRCGRCVSGCPMNLIPTTLEKLALSGDVKGLEENHVMVCMECGTCAFNCPAKRRLVQSIRLGKNLVKNAAAKKKG